MNFPGAAVPGGASPLATFSGTVYTPPMHSLTITEKDHCRRVESLLQNLLPSAPLSYLRKSVKSGHVTVNGAPTHPDAELRRGDTVSLKESQRVRELLGHRPPHLDILFEDQWIIVFNKEAGLAVHRAAEVKEENLVEQGQMFLRKRERLPDTSPMKLRPVNRLDRGTSGVIVLAKSPTAAGMFGRMVREEGFGKLYLAVAEGELPSEGTIAAPLEGKESETRYRVLFQGKDAAFVAVTPVSGRMHQIRQHFRLIGHPILGDKRYGGRQLSGYSGHALHSFRTSFVHPATGESHRIHAPLPDNYLRLIRKIAGEAFEGILKQLPDL